MNYMFLADNGNEYGPYTVDDLYALAGENRLQPESKLRRADGHLTTAGVVLSYWSRPASQQQTYRPPAPTNSPNVQPYRPSVQPYRPSVQPYRPSVQPMAVEQDMLNYAPIGLRIGACLIDAVIFGIVYWGWVALTFVAALAGNEPLTKFMSVISYGLPFGITFLCYVFLAGTPGKLLLGLRIVSLDGTQPTAGQIFKRMFLYYLIGIFAIWGVFTGPEYRSIAEKWAGTATVKIN